MLVYTALAVAMASFVLFATAFLFFGFKRARLLRPRPARSGETEPDGDLSPGLIRALLVNRLDDQGLCADLCFLAAKGRLDIIPIDRGVRLIRKADAPTLPVWVETLFYRVFLRENTVDIAIRARNGMRTARGEHRLTLLDAAAPLWPIDRSKPLVIAYAGAALTVGLVFLLGEISFTRFIFTLLATASGAVLAYSLNRNLFDFKTYGPASLWQALFLLLLLAVVFGRELFELDVERLGLTMQLFGVGLFAGLIPPVAALPGKKARRIIRWAVRRLKEGDLNDPTGFERAALALALDEDAPGETANADNLAQELHYRLVEMYFHNTEAT